MNFTYTGPINPEDGEVGPEVPPPEEPYSGYEPRAAYDYPEAFIEDDEEEPAADAHVDPEMLQDEPRSSVVALAGVGVAALALIVAVILTALTGRCQGSLDSSFCTLTDLSSREDRYTFETFNFYIPSVYVWGAMASGLFGLTAMSVYAFQTVKEDVGSPRMVEIATYIRQGAIAFMNQEFVWLVPLVIVLGILAGFAANWSLAGSYFIGAALSFVTGYLGMSIATKGNVRTAAAAQASLAKGLNVAFRAGAVMGLSVVAIGLTGLTITYFIFRDIRALAGFSAGASTIALFARVGGGIYTKAADVGADLVGKVEANIPEDDPRNPATIADNVGDNVGDVAGMGADLFESYVGSLVATAFLGASLPYFYNQRFALCVYNHLSIDLACGPTGNAPNFVSMANRICSDPDIFSQYPLLGTFSSQTIFIALPFMLACVGVLVSVLCTAYVHVPASAGGHKSRAETMETLLWSLRTNVLVAGGLIILASFGLTFGFFGPNSTFMDNPGFSNDNIPVYRMDTAGRETCLAEFNANGTVLPLPRGEFGTGFYQPTDSLFFEYPKPSEVWWRLWLAIIIGLALGVTIGFLTEFFTAGNAQPTQGIASAGEYGAGAVVIQGLGVGMLSTVLPLLLVSAVILGSYNLFGTYAIALSAVGMLSTLGVTMATDAYGPVADNAGGIAEMAELPSSVRDNTDALDALGNTTAATGKGFSNGSAVLTAYALLAALVQDSGLAPSPRGLVSPFDPVPTDTPQDFIFLTTEVSLVDIFVVASLLLGIMLPFLFGAFTMLAVSRAAQAMIVEVRRQFNQIAGLREGRPGVRPDHIRCVQISTRSAIIEMVMPGVVAIMSPLIIGFGFGQKALIGLLLGAIASGYMMGIMMSNAGGAWDNAKKLVESGFFGKANAKGSEWHKSTVAGDTVGDPFKDTSGPSMNILIKMMTVFGLVAVPLMNPDKERGWVGLILFLVTLIFGLVFLTLKAFYDKKVGEQAAAGLGSDTEQTGVEKFQSKISPYYEAGPGYEMNKIYHSSAMKEAYDAVGGDRAFERGIINDPFNLPLLGNNTRDMAPMAAYPAEGEAFVPDKSRRQ